MRGLLLLGSGDGSKGGTEAGGDAGGGGGDAAPASANNRALLGAAAVMGKPCGQAATPAPRATGKGAAGKGAAAKDLGSTASPAAAAAATARPAVFKSTSLDGLWCGPEPDCLLTHLAACHGSLLACVGRRDLRDPTVFHVAVERKAVADDGEADADTGGAEFVFVGPRRAASTKPLPPSMGAGGKGTFPEHLQAAPASLAGNDKDKGKGKKRAGPEAPVALCPSAAFKRSKQPAATPSSLSPSSSSALVSAAAAATRASATAHAAAAGRVAAFAAAEAAGCGLGGGIGLGLGLGAGGGTYAASVSSSSSFSGGGASTLPVRQYYHSRTGVPMTPQEMDVDSDGSWQAFVAVRALSFTCVVNTSARRNESGASALARGHTVPPCGLSNLHARARLFQTRSTTIGP
jgi:hypothetical protein